jgi:hypothetical protein
MAIIELGVDTFGDITAGADGQLLTHAQVIRDVVEEGVLADELGIDFIGLGSTTARISRSRRPTWCWRRSARAPSASISAPR